MRILVRFTTCAGHDLEEVRQAPAARHRASGRRTGLNATCVQHRAVTFESVRSGTQLTPAPPKGHFLHRSPGLSEHDLPTSEATMVSVRSRPAPSPTGTPSPRPPRRGAAAAPSHHEGSHRIADE